MSNLSSLHKTLLTEWAAEQKDLTAVGKTLKTLKIELNNLQELEKLSDDAATTIHRDFFEISALYNVIQGDDVGFEEAIADVHSFYSCQKDEPRDKYLMYGLHLMYLLAKNKLSDFHMLLEQIGQNVQQTNPYISMPVQLEQSLMEGAYNKVTLNEKNIPSPYYASFVRVLIDTVRNDIATCIEKSFEHLVIKDATQMLLFNDEKELFAFAQGRGWPIEKNLCRFQSKPTGTGTTTRAALDTKRIALQNIYYAKQLEMIV